MTVAVARGAVLPWLEGVPTSPPRPHVVCISQARIGSERLPGKVLRTVGGRTLLEHHLTRLKHARLIDTLVLATTVNPADDPVAEVARRLGVGLFRGSEDDVLDRYVRCAAVFDADVVVRVTADCPLIDPAVTDAAIVRFFETTPAPDLVHVEIACFPRGLDSEVIALPALIHAHRHARTQREREHVTRHFYDNADRFRIVPFAQPGRYGELRWCVDEPADLALVGRLIDALAGGPPDFGWRDCVGQLVANPEWMALNRDVRQRHP